MINDPWHVPDDATIDDLADELVRLRQTRRWWHHTRHSDRYDHRCQALDAAGMRRHGEFTWHIAVMMRIPTDERVPYHGGYPAGQIAWAESARPRGQWV